MEKVEITKSMIDWARAHPFRGTKPRGIRADSWELGRIGEAVFQHLWPAAVFVDNAQYDFALGDLRVDLKTQMIAGHPPRGDYLLNVLARQWDKQGCSLFAWVFVDELVYHAWIAGWIGLREMGEVAIRWPKGATKTMPSGRVFEFLEETMEVPLSSLRAFAPRRADADR